MLEQFMALIATGAAVVAVAILCGYGAVRWSRPQGLGSVEAFLVPAAGIAVWGVGAYWVGAVLPMGRGAWLLVGLGGASLAVVWLSEKGPWTWPGRVEAAAVVAAAAVTLGLAAFPWLSRPELLAVGPNWDAEVYLPLAEALARYPNGFSAAHTAGVPFPDAGNALLWRLKFFDPRSGGLAFSLLHAGVNVVTGLPADRTYAPLLAWLAALTVPGVWALLRGGLQLGPVAALWGAGFVGVNAAALYVTFLGFGQQVTAMVLLPAALAVGVAALRSGDRKTAMLAGLLLAGLMATYSPALPLYAAAMGMAGAVRLRSLDRRKAVAGGFTLVGTAVVLSPMALARLGQRLAYFLAEGGTSGLTTGPQVQAYAPLAWGLGLLPGPGVGVGWTAPLELPWATPAVSLILVGVLALLGTFGLAVTRRTPGSRDAALTMVALVGGAVALLSVLRLGAGYPYGYFKLLPMAAPLLVATVATGLAHLGRTGNVGLRIGAPALGGVLLLLAGVTGATAALAAKASSVHGFAAAAVLRQVVPAGATVCVEGGPGLEGPPAAAALLFLQHADVYGYVRTGYGTMYRPAPAGCAFELATALAQRAPTLYAWDRPVWEGIGWRLTARRTDVVAYRDLGQVEQGPVIARNPNPGRSGTLRADRWDAAGNPLIDHWSPPLLGVLSVTAGPQVRLLTLDAPGQFLTVAADRVALSSEAGDAAGPPTGRRTLELTVVAFRADRLRLQASDGLAVEEVVEVGVSTVSVPVQTPSMLHITSVGRGAMYVAAAAVAVTEGVRSVPSVVRHDGVVAVDTTDSSVSGADARLELRTTAGDLSPVLDVYRDDGAVHFGWWRLQDGSAGQDGRISATLDLGAKAARSGAGRPLEGEHWPSGDGLYRGFLVLYEGGTPVRQVPVLAFRVVAGVVQESALELRGVALK